MGSMSREGCNWRTVNIDELRKQRKKQHNLEGKQQRLLVQGKGADIF
jgi:hypothetical protein